MKIQEIEIKCFQKHEFLHLKFNDDINIISGLTDTGKSGIFRAMEWVCNFSNISESDYRKENTKETSVKIWLDNEFVIERIRANSINRYILSKKGMEDKVFDNFGKETPEDIKIALEIDSIDVENEHVNLNFANQDQINFLLDSTYSDTFKAKLFNKLTGNEILDKIFKECNRKNLKYMRDIKDTEESVVKLEEQLAEHSIEYNKSKKQLVTVKKLYEKIKEDIEIYNNLNDLLNKIKANKEAQEYVDYKKAQIKTINENKLIELKNKAIELDKIKDIYNSLDKINLEIELNNKNLKNIKDVNIDSDSLKLSNEKIQQLLSIKQQLLSSNEKLLSVKKDIVSKEDLLKLNEIELEKLWAECKTCPLCNQEIK